MLRLFAILLVCACFHTAIAQKSAVTNAVLYHKDNKLKQAVEEIDDAAQHEKTANEAKTWYYKGLIYKSVSDAGVNDLFPGADSADQVAITSFRKSIELDEAQGNFYNLSMQQLLAMYPDYINKGYGFYNTMNFEKALRCFETAQKINPQDTTGYLYASFAAEEMGRYDLVKNNIENLENLGYKNPQLYAQKISIVNNEEGNPEKALEIAEEALKEFPGNPDLLEAQTNIFLQQSKFKGAINNLKILSAMAPENSQYLLVLASAYNKSGDTDNALQNYDKVISLDPENFNALYNKAAIFFEQGRKVYEEVHAMNIDTYQANGKEKEKEMEQYFQKSKETALKALDLATEEEDQSSVNVLLTQISKLSDKH